MADAEKEKKADLTKVIVLGPRLAFESLYTPKTTTFDDGNTGTSWKATLLFEKEKLDGYQAKYMGQKMPLMKALKLAGNEARKAAWGASPDKWPKLKPEKLYWRDGDLEEYDGFPGTWYASTNAQVDQKPVVITNRKDGNGKWMAAQPGTPGAPYSGCYVNATIRLWCQDNKHGKRLNAEIKAVQFFADGESFKAQATDPNNDFDDDDVGEAGDMGSDAGDDDSMI